MSWSGHYHGYGPWIGTPESYHKEGNRRPPHPDPPVSQGPEDKAAERVLARYREVAAEFPTSDLPPMMTGHWLMKRSQAARDRTWTDPAVALEWMTQNYRAHPPFEREDGRRAYESLDVKRDYVIRVLPGGVDVTWAYYNRAGNIVSMSVVCCPNRHHPDLACPLPPL